MDVQPRPRDDLGLEALAELVDSREPYVRQFVAVALAESERLTNAVRVAETRSRAIEARTFLDVGHRDRLEDLILMQEADIARLNAVIGRVRALLELAQWSAQTTEPAERVTILAEDLEVALSQDS